MATATARASHLLDPAEAGGESSRMERARSERGSVWLQRATAAGWAVIGVMYAIEAATIMRANRMWLVHRLPDDAFYYLETARHIARGQGPTFDGVHHTNGFHPLWQAMTAVLAFGFRGGDSLVKAALLTNLALSVAAAVLVYRLLRRVVGSLGAVVAVLVSVHATAAMSSWVNGMESAALLAVLALMLTALDRFDHRRDLCSAALAGGAAALVVLARVDMATVIWLVPFWIWARCRAGRPWRMLSVWAVAAAVPLGAWAGFSLVWVGHVLPVSGSLKLWSMSEYAGRFGGLLTFGYAAFGFSFVHYYLASVVTSADSQSIRGFPLTLLALSGLVLLGARSLLRPDRAVGARVDRVARGALLLGLALVVAKAAADIALLPYWAEAWYSAPARFAAGLLIGLGAYECIALAVRHFRVVGIVLATLAIVAVFPFDGLRFVRSPSEPPYPWSWQDADVEAVAWIAAHGPVGVYGSTDAGLLGYYLDPGRTVVNLDGLINDYRYASMLERGVPPLPRYQAEGVRYLVGRLGAPGSLNVPTCAVQLWRSSREVIYGGSGDSPGISSIPIRVYDLGACPVA